MQRHHHLNILNSTTCYSAHSNYNVNCNKKDCNNWISRTCSNNCAIIAAHKGSHTLQEIGDIFNVTRMRTCQLEHEILRKIKNNQIDD